MLKVNGAVMSEQANGTADRAMANVEAKANLLLALYSHAAHELELIRAEADRLRGELADVRRDFEIADKARKDVERTYLKFHEQMTGRVAQLEQEHAAILGSTSWRITAPVRAAVRMVKR
jgi:hypothetical protein